ncbi:hypothetical protein M3Y99_00832700 [Aphelenchoides fujianensis]|nr:hypothetical protein M3Y99_00832700 [Aphelenchoides fujianensis]
MSAQRKPHFTARTRHAFMAVFNPYVQDVHLQHETADEKRKIAARRLLIGRRFLDTLVAPVDLAPKRKELEDGGDEAEQKEASGSPQAEAQAGAEAAEPPLQDDLEKRRRERTNRLICVYTHSSTAAFNLNNESLATDEWDPEFREHLTHLSFEFFEAEEVGALLALVEAEHAEVHVPELEINAEAIHKWEQIGAGLTRNRTLKAIHLHVERECPGLEMVLDLLPDKITHFSGLVDANTGLLLKKRATVVEKLEARVQEAANFDFHHLFDAKVREFHFKPPFDLNAWHDCGRLPTNETIERVRVYVCLDQFADCDEPNGRAENVAYVRECRQAMEWLKTLNDRFRLHVDHELVVASDFPTVKVFRRKLNALLGGARKFVRVAEEVGVRVGSVDLELVLNDTGPDLFDSKDLAESFRPHKNVHEFKRAEEWTTKTKLFAEEFRNVSIVFRFLKNYEL